MPRPDTRLDADERFWQRVVGVGGCLLWQGHIADNGYGQIKRDGTVQYAHRYAFVASGGELPPGTEVDHTCRVRACVNPNHLRAATRSQNNQNHGGPQSNSTTGVRGVSYRPDCPAVPYEAAVQVNGVRHLGRYATIEEAAEAVVAMRLQRHTHNERDRSQR